MGILEGLIEEEEEEEVCLSSLARFFLILIRTESGGTEILGVTELINLRDV